MVRNPDSFPPHPNTAGSRKGVYLALPVASGAPAEVAVRARAKPLEASVSAREPLLSPRRKRVTASAEVRPLVRLRVSAGFLSVAFWFSLAALTGAQTSPPPTPQSVVQALESHDIALALRLARDFARAHPTDPRAWTLQGIALQGLERPQESLAAFEHALQIDPNNVAALEGAAQLEFQAGSPKALPFLEKLLRLNPRTRRPTR